MTQTSTRRHESDSSGFGTQIAFGSINDPGCYICNWSGHLIRIPEDSVKPGRSPVMSIIGRETPYVTKISDNPFVPLSKARMLAADCDVAVNF